MKNKKYELTDETMDFYGVILHRIVAIKDFSDVKSGDSGGWVESEKNLNGLSHKAWIYGNAKAIGNSHIAINTRIYDNTVVKDIFMNDDISIYGDSIITGSICTDQISTLHTMGIRINGEYIDGEIKIWDSIINIKEHTYGNLKIAGGSDLTLNDGLMDLCIYNNRIVSEEEFNNLISAPTLF